MRDEDWRAHAVCRHHDPMLWYPEYGSHGPGSAKKKAEQDRSAKAICAQCPVRRECLDSAVKRRERHGIWGGLNEDERKALKRRE
ncbi:WhiB family transcriptional regulator [Mycolicibacterium mucogenicum]|uniref:WhiB family transcriptional regulator n=1 Tax=Mycolicibacterium mucogenicum TaxID=56689 RepID=UPI00226A3AE8|nr:WhiB family transcriptional regulator [Mycolicibacterium mucogenicum]